MRTRLIRPEFFADAKLADLSYGARLFYIGLWCRADDLGYLTWEPREIAAALFPYEPEPERITHFEEWTAALVGIGRVRLIPCGLHAVVPTLPRHRQKGGRLVSSIHETHLRTCKDVRVREGTSEGSTNPGFPIESPLSTYADVRVRPVRTESESESESGTYAYGLSPAEVMEQAGGFAAALVNGQKESRPTEGTRSTGSQEGRSPRKRGAVGDRLAREGKDG